MYIPAKIESTSLNHIDALKDMIPIPHLKSAFRWVFQEQEKLLLNSQ